MNAARSAPPGGRDPHSSTPTLRAGPIPKNAAATIILLHGRGASAEDILGLYGEIARPDVAALAPQAAGNAWYPYSFLVPVDANQPFLDSALRRIETLVNELLAGGVASEKILLLGFSQGACLTCEFIARNPRRFGGAVALTGGLFGPDGSDWKYPGTLSGTPVFLGTSDPDPHVPLTRVKQTAEVLTRLGASVDLRSYPGMPHTVNDEELDACRAMLAKATGRQQE